MNLEVALNITAAGKPVFPACLKTKAPLVRGWQNQATVDPGQIRTWSRTFRNCAWGLPCGPLSDIFVLDLDTCSESKVATGRASLSLLGYSRLVEGPSVITPSGGEHLYFRDWSGARNTVSKLGDKIDTRAGGGYVIAPGCQMQHGSYSGDVAFDSLPSFPMGLRARLSSTAAQRRSPLDLVAPPKLEEARELLSYITPDLSYDEWLSVLMALHHAYDGSYEGQELADEWSQGGCRYQPGCVEARWPGFGQRKGVTWATVPALAKKHGADLSDIAKKHRGAAHD